MVIRERYLKLIRPFYDQELIKVLIGIRRSGKSVILKQIIDELKENNVDDNHIIYINFEDYDYEEYTDSKKLNNYVKERIIDDKKYYIFLLYILPIEIEIIVGKVIEYFIEVTLLLNISIIFQINKDKNIIHIIN